MSLLYVLASLRVLLSTIKPTARQPVLVAASTFTGRYLKCRWELYVKRNLLLHRRSICNILSSMKLSMISGRVNPRTGKSI